MGQTNQSWNSQPALIVLSTNIVAIGSSATCYMTNTGGISLATAQIMWEAVGQSPSIGLTRTLTPTNAGSIRVEAEAVLPDGRRLFARTNFTAAEAVTNNIEDYQSINLSNNTAVIAWYKGDGTLTDNEGVSTDLSFMTGDETYDSTSFIWTNRAQAGQAIKVNWRTNGVTKSIANSVLKSGTAISIEMMIYPRAWTASGQGHADVFTLYGPASNELNMYQNSGNANPVVVGGGSSVANEAAVAAAIPLNKWSHIKIILDASGYTFYVNGVSKGTFADAGDYAGWSDSGNSTFYAGGFDGWIDEIVIKNAP